WKDRESGEQKEATEWHNLVFSKKLAEIAGQYLKKGSKIYVEGSLRTENWTDKEGKERYTTKVRVHDLQMLDGKPRGDGEQTGSRTPPPTAAQQARAAAYGARPPAAPAEMDAPFEDDDIPF
ncbi:MAG: single-stranded DNA-binding protein, partial [Solimonas sp.]